jgi:predicted DNA-binding ribbon-helix-helix protein
MYTHMKTTVEISDPLLDEAKRIAARDSTTVRELIETGLRAVVKARRTSRQGFALRDARVGGNGLSRELREASWDRIREAAYEGRGG